MCLLVLTKSACVRALSMGGWTSVYPLDVSRILVDVLWSRSMQKGRQFILSIQRPDGSWYGSWGVCFTYGNYNILGGGSVARCFFSALISFFISAPSPKTSLHPPAKVRKCWWIFYFFCWEGDNAYHIWWYSTYSCSMVTWLIRCTQVFSSHVQ